MSLIEGKNLTFSYDGSPDPVFEDLSFRIDTDWRLGLIGRNGRGKTTLLRLFLGEEAGRGSITGLPSLAYYPCPVSEDETGRDAARRELREEPDWRLERELGLLKLSPELLDRPFSTLSGGERAKLLLAVLFLREGDWPLIDEPTNHLDLEGRETAADYLRRKRGFLLVSHDRAFLDRCVDHVLILPRAGGAEVERGNFSSWWENRRRRDAFEQGENEKRKKEIRQLSAAAKRTADWSDQVEKTKFATKNSGLRPDRGYIGHKSAKLMKRSKAMEDRRSAAVEERVGLLKNVETAQPLKLHPLDYRARTLCELRDVSPQYNGRPVGPPVTFTVERGDRIALRGPNGSGKSSLLKLLAGAELDHDGLVRRGGGLVVSVVPQDAGALAGDLSQLAAEARIDESLFKTVLRKLDFSRALFERDAGSYSEGQKKKVLLARSLCQRADLYLWDEPMNYIDVFSRMQIEDLLLEYPPTLVFVEHDEAFCKRVATRTVEVERG